jgi:hypothetical protein
MRLRLRLKAGSLGIQAAPTLSGDAVVGQTIYATPGTYAATPDSVSPTWTVGGVTISDATGDTLLINDIYAGLAIGYSEVAHKAGYVDSASNAATSTGSVANIDLTSAIGLITRTSSSGTIPMVVNIAFGSNVYAGYFIDRVVYTDSGLTTLKGATLADSTASHQLSNDDLQSGATIDWSLNGGPSIAATDWVQYSVRTTSPNGIGHSFTYMTPISPTDAVVTMTWSSTDHGTGVLISNGNLTAFGNFGSGVASARTNRAYSSSGKFYHELHIDNDNMYAAVADASANLDATASNELFGGGAANSHEAVYWKNGFTDFNGTANSGYATYVTGDGVDQAVDVTAKKVWWRVASGDGASAGSWLPSGDPAAGTGGLDISAMTGSLYPAVQVASNGQATARFSGFTRTPPSGFSAP